MQENSKSQQPDHEPSTPSPASAQPATINASLNSFIILAIVATIGLLVGIFGTVNSIVASSQISQVKNTLTKLEGYVGVDESDLSDDSEESDDDDDVVYVDENGNVTDKDGNPVDDDDSDDTADEKSTNNNNQNNNNQNNNS